MVALGDGDISAGIYDASFWGKHNHWILAIGISTYIWFKKINQMSVNILLHGSYGTWILKNKKPVKVCNDTLGKQPFVQNLRFDGTLTGI